MPTLPPQFEQLITLSDLPVLVDFYADWCGPCKMVSPVITQLAKEYKGKILTVKVDTDKKQELAQAYQIQSIPTIMLFHRGKALMRLTGAHPYGNLKRELDRALSEIPA